MNTLEQLRFDDTYARLPGIFWSEHRPVALDSPFLIHFNRRAADLIELDPAEARRRGFLDAVCGKVPLAQCRPIAMCYAGHQFGHYVPRLGDGRAILLAEVRTAAGAKWDLQLKGAGQTLYSRGGDGRAVLRSTLREYLCSEAMHGLGIPTTRALCLIGGREEVYRERIEPGAMLLRMAPSHVRFGTFEYFYYQNRFEDLKVLADYVIGEHLPACLEVSNPYLALLEEAIRSTARLIAQWQAVGFAHGVMNTDNMSILGLTLDYGPYGFLDRFEAGFVCNHSDHTGRYAFDHQPEIGLFNTRCLAQALLPLIHRDPERAAELATAALGAYEGHFRACHAERVRDKLGFREIRDGDLALWNGLLKLMEQGGADYTLMLRTLSQADPVQRDSRCRELFREPAACDAWLRDYQARLDSEGRAPRERAVQMRLANPKFVLRNYIAELAIRKAEDHGDYSEIDRLMDLLQTPFDEHPESTDYAGPPPDWAAGITLSCSS